MRNTNDLLELDDFRHCFNSGLELAARIAEDWARECEDFGPKAGEGYRNLAASFRKRMR